MRRKVRTLLTVFVMSCALTQIASAQTTKRTVGGHVACVSRANLNKVMDFVAAGDKVAFNRFINNDANQCIILKKNLEVYIETYKFTVIEIRMKGKTFTVWTVAEAVR